MIRWPVYVCLGMIMGSIYLHWRGNLSAAGVTTAFSNCIALDGDTMRCAERRIRLLGIDAAELPGHCRRGRDCALGDPYLQRDALRRFIRGGGYYTAVAMDRYGRTIAIVRNAGGQNASCEMLKSGARYMPRWDSRFFTALDCYSASYDRR